MNLKTIVIGGIEIKVEVMDGIEINIDPDIMKRLSTMNELTFEDHKQLQLDAQNSCTEDEMEFIVLCLQAVSEERKRLMIINQLREQDNEELHKLADDIESGKIQRQDIDVRRVSSLLTTDPTSKECETCTDLECEHSGMNQDCPSNKDVKIVHPGTNTIQ